MSSFSAREKKWQDIWKGTSPADSGTRGKVYVLSMFPYPSGRLHMGHMRNYTIGDVFSRFKAAQGCKVLQPMGWDAHGLPAENAAKLEGVSPRKWTQSNIKSMKREMQAMGLAVDWSREIATCDPDYYKHQQEMFLIFLRKGIAYQKEDWVNWDPVDKTTLANEQVINGRGWRSGALIEKKKMKQWFFRIRNFAEDLLNQELPGWPPNVKKMQKNWIGKSTGISFDFPLQGGGSLRVYSTRPETVFGASFIGIGLEHPSTLEEMKKDEELRKFVEEHSRNQSHVAPKAGYKTSLSALHPFTEEALPVYVTNFILMEYGTGAVFGCPAHDKRDFEFAEKYDLPIRQVIEPDSPSTLPYTREAGKVTLSEFIDGMKVKEARARMIRELKGKCAGKVEVMYKLKDWGVSRQRAWGCPIPILYCSTCGIVEAADLPVKPPKDLDYSKGGNPLDNHQWATASCSKCGGRARRETDTLDTFVDSSWYFLRFCSPSNSDEVMSKEDLKWLPVDYYIGGVEHAILHLLYARFFTKVLFKEGIINFDEPFLNLFTQGMVCHKTFKGQDGKWLYPEEVTISKGVFKDKKGREIHVGPSEAMSKSKKNTITPSSIFREFGVDAARWFILSDTPPEKDIEWNEAGMRGAARFLDKVYSMALKISKNDYNETDIPEELALAQNNAIRQVTEFFSTFQMNRALAEIHKLYNAIEKFRTRNVEPAVKTLIQLMYPVTPHLSEEAWSFFSSSTLFQTEFWRKVEPAKGEASHQIAVQVNGKLRGILPVEKSMCAAQVEEKALSLDKIRILTQNKTVRKVIFIPGKVVNVVVS